MSESDADLFPVGGDDAYLARCNDSMAFLSTWLQQFSHIVHQHLHLCHIKERGAALLTLVYTSHAMKDEREVLRGRPENMVGCHVKWFGCQTQTLNHVSTDSLSVPAVQILVALPIEVNIF